LLGVEEDDEENELDVFIDRTSDTFVDNLFALYDETPVELKPGRHLRVMFVDESGIDGGVVSREFFFIVLEALLSRQICAGPADVVHVVSLRPHAVCPL